MNEECAPRLCEVSASLREISPTPDLCTMQTPATSAPDRYAQRGVSAQKEDVHAAIAGLDKGLFPRAFCKVVPDWLGGDDAFCTVMHADGAGTKSALAWAYWRETGDLSIWRGIATSSAPSPGTGITVSGLMATL